jgi:hypothetical protein
MSSYISSFKAVFVALAIVGAVETSYAALVPSSPAEASNYLNWNFNSTDTFHKLLINEKLANAVRGRPDVIQIGDSSGLHGIVPSIVDQYLGGLRYENLSCCMNTGFDGYNSIAQFMLRNVPSIKAVVLYIDLNATPRKLGDDMTALVGGEDRLRSAFGPLSIPTTPPTLAARPDVLRWVYTFGHTHQQWGLMPFADRWPELVHSIRATRGWRPEQDVHLLPETQPQKVTELCGPSGTRTIMRHQAQDYARDIFGVGRTYTEIELRRLADLTASYQAKLIILIQPYPCRAFEGSFLPSLRADIAAVMAAYPNVDVPDPKLFEAWPGSWFSSPEHLRTGHEEAASRRAGRLIAKALHISFDEPPALIPKPPVSVISSTDAPFSSWKTDGLSLAQEPNGAGVLALETAASGPHLLEKTMPSLPAGTYKAVLTFRSAGERQLYLQFFPIRWPGDAGNFVCNAATGEVSRIISVVDSAIENLPANSLKCSGTFKIVNPGAIIQIGLTRTSPPAPYQGDGAGSITLFDFELLTVDDPYSSR